MRATAEDIIDYVENEDIKFIRLAFCDVFGKQKNISIMPGELRRAFEHGIAFDASAIKGFGGNVFSDLFLHPDPDTLSVLPWRPEHGRVVKMYCTISTPDGKPFINDTRALLINAEKKAEAENIGLLFGSRAEFYLFDIEADGSRTTRPFDKAGCMDVAPLDKGENVRRQVCLNLEEMGISAESSCHLGGAGQNAIKLGRSGITKAADDLMSFFNAVKAAAGAEGRCADFSPKPLADMPGSGLSIEISPDNELSGGMLGSAAAGIAEHLYEITLFLDPKRSSYERLRKDTLRQAVCLTETGGRRSIELCTPDCTANPYLLIALLTHAALDGIKRGLTFGGSGDIPASYEEAVNAASGSGFVSRHIPNGIAQAYFAER
ncbi:MAG: glutamine synthetase family protein [Ruminococcus sp.]|nr:glutamine synthetase family protein [Ruminococcus sp.]